MRKLLIYGALGWAGYRVYRARQLGVPLDAAFSQPLKSVGEIWMELETKRQRLLEASGQSVH